MANVHMSKSKFFDEKKLRDFEEGIQNPNKFVQKLIKKYKPDGIKLKNMMQTAGWKDVFEPFLIHSGNADKLFDMSEEKRKTELPKIEAYNRLLRFVKNMAGFADISVEDEGEEEEESPVTEETQ